MTGAERPDLLGPVDLLAAAFQRRDLAAALACFVPDNDISYTGSEAGESAEGRAAVAAVLAELFARPEAYSWTIQSANVVARAGIGYVACELLGTVRADAGGTESFPYRLSGLLERTRSGWLWRACHGCEPTAAEGSIP